MMAGEEGGDTVFTTFSKSLAIQGNSRRSLARKES